MSDWIVCKIMSVTEPKQMQRDGVFRGSPADNRCQSVRSGMGATEPRPARLPVRVRPSSLCSPPFYRSVGRDAVARDTLVREVSYFGMKCDEFTLCDVSTARLSG